MAFQTENSGQERGEEDWIRFNLHETGGHLLQKIPSKKFVKRKKERKKERKKAGWMDGWRCANVSSLCVCVLFLSIGNKLFYDISHKFNNC